MEGGIKEVGQRTYVIDHLGDRFNQAFGDCRSDSDFCNLETENDRGWSSTGECECVHFTLKASELCWEEVMVAYTKPQQREKEGGVEEEREARSSLLIWDLKDGKLLDSGKQEEGKIFHKLHVLGMNDDLLDTVCGLGSETWKGCEWLVPYKGSPEIVIQTSWHYNGSSSSAVTQEEYEDRNYSHGRRDQCRLHRIFHSIGIAMDVGLLGHCVCVLLDRERIGDWDRLFLSLSRWRSVALTALLIWRFQMGLFLASSSQETSNLPSVDKWRLSQSL